MLYERIVRSSFVINLNAVLAILRTPEHFATLTELKDQEASNDTQKVDPCEDKIGCHFIHMQLYQ